MNQKNYCFFDLETTGKSITRDRIVQLSAIAVDQQLNQSGSAIELFFNPKMPIPQEAVNVHGITNDMVKDAPVFKSLATGIAAYFSDCIICGYNIMAYDIPLLSEEFGRVGIEWPSKETVIIDVYKIFALKEKRDLANALKFYTGKAIEGAHNAVNDNLATIEVLKGQLEMYPDLREMDHAALYAFCNDGKKNVDLAGKIVLNDDGIPVYSFGKSQGVPVAKDRGYGEWMLKNDFPANTKKVIRDILKIK